MRHLKLTFACFLVGASLTLSGCGRSGAEVSSETPSTATASSSSSACCPKFTSYKVPPGSYCRIVPAHN